MATIKKACKGALYPKSSSVSKRLGSPSKAKNGKSFPDLTGDGKVTKADILKGRGVIAKKGKMVKKAAPKKAMMAKAPMQQSSPMPSAMMKKGGKMKKCAYGCK